MRFDAREKPWVEAQRDRRAFSRVACVRALSRRGVPLSRMSSRGRCPQEECRIALVFRLAEEWGEFFLHRK